MPSPKSSREAGRFTRSRFNCQCRGSSLSFGILSMVVLFAVVSSQDLAGEGPDISGMQSKLTACETRSDQLSNSLKQSLGAAAKLAESSSLIETLKNDYAQLEKTFEETKEKFQTENSRTQLIEQNLAACQKGEYSKMEDLQREHDSLIQSRLQLANELEISKADLVAAKGDKNELEAKIAVLTPKVNALVACKESKAELKSKLEVLETHLGEEKSDLENQKTSCQSELNSSIQTNTEIVQLLAKHEMTNAQLVGELAKQDGYLFSLKQLRVTAFRYWVVVSSAVRYAVKEAYSRLSKYIPSHWQSELRETWHQKVVLTWKMKIAPLYQNSVRSHDAWKMTARIYNKNLHPHLVRLFYEAKEATLRGCVVIQAIGAKYTEVANKIVSEYAVAPFVQQYPQVAPFIPGAPLDRLCFLGFVFLATRFALAVFCYPVRLLLGLACCILGTIFPCCRKGRQSTSHLKKSKRHRKPFQPAAIATSNVQRPMKDQQGTAATTNAANSGVGGKGDKDARRAATVPARK